jgi:hypothetical protein
MGDVIPFGRFERPYPPKAFLDDPLNRFTPSTELRDWIQSVFIDEAGPLHNPEHAHLQGAVFGVCWTLVGNTRGGRRIIGQAEFAKNIGGNGGRWAKARAHQQLEEWFGRGAHNMLDFLLTFDAYHCAECSDAELCALIEHELYHCAQQYRDGMPLFSKATGRPMYALRGHDVEEFVGVVRRYGAGATGVTELVQAANRGPEIAGARISHACGTCQERRTG